MDKNTLLMNSNNRSVPSDSRWGPEKRIEFIDFRLLWDRTVNRKDLMEFFRISIQQASADIAHYCVFAPDNMVYDRNAKTYRATEDFRPLTLHFGASHYLSELLGQSTGTIAPSSSMIGWQPPHEVVKYPSRPVNTVILIGVITAIRERSKIEILYQSMRMPSLDKRWISPHSLAFDGSRWHIRAWCDEVGKFCDFVISRIREIGQVRDAAVSIKDDDWWNTYVDIVVEPRPGLTADQRDAIEIDFAMDGGQLVVHCRKALAYYHLRQLGLDRLPHNVPPVAQPLELVNRKELNEVIVAAQKVSDRAS